MDTEKEIDERLEDWVNQQSDHTCIALSARIALWVLPIAVREGRLSQLDDTLALRAMRYVQLAMVASVDNGMNLRRTAYRLNFHIGKGDASFAAIGAANFARRSVAATSDDPPSVAEQMNTEWRGTPQFLLLQAYLAARRARGTIWSDQGEYSELTAFERLPDRSGVPDPVSLHKTRLVPFAAEPVGRERRVGHYLHQRNGPWSFWSRWYERAMAGDPLPWDLQREVVLIPDGIWEQGPEAVAGRIAEIEARFEVKERLRSLSPETDLQLVTSRHGIGGNSPPESIETPREVQQSVTIIWAEIGKIAEEVEEETPDKSRIRSALNALKTALGVCLKWFGMKLDLAVEVAIKATVTAAASGIAGGAVAAALAGPEKLQAFIQAVENWLTHLP